MQITVVIPTYQRPQLLRKCLTALQKQSLPKAAFEVIVVSDGPDEITATVVNEFNTLIALRYFSTPGKKGPAAARNLGWLNAKAPVIAFTDDDCLPDARWLEFIIQAADAGRAQAFTGKVIVPLDKRPTDHALNTAGLETADFVTANCACTKIALTAVGGFDERFALAWREDSDLEFKLISHAIPIKRLESAVVVHPVRQARWGNSIKEQKKTLFNALLYRKHPEMYRDRVAAKPPVFYYLAVVGVFMLLIGLIFAKQDLTLPGLSLWLGATVYFIVKRLRNTSLSPNHIAEMVFTSMIIPFYSVYWHWYGAFKYHALFL